MGNPICWFLWQDQQYCVLKTVQWVALCFIGFVIDMAHTESWLLEKSAAHLGNLDLT
jgi:hypothetical protein